MFDPRDQTVFNVESFQVKSTDLMFVENLSDFIFEVLELMQFCVKVFKFWVLAVEKFEFRIDFLAPKPIILFEALEEYLDLIFGALDGTSKQQNNLNDFLVFCNPVIEGFTFVLRDVFLVPVLHMFSTLKNVRCCSVNS